MVIVNKKVYCLNYTGEVFKIPINLNQPFNESQSLDSDGRKPETKIRDLKMKNVTVRESVQNVSVSQHQQEKEPVIYTALTGDSQCFLAGYSFDTNSPTCSVGFALYNSRTLKRQTSLNIVPQTVTPETTKLEDVHHKGFHAPASWPAGYGAAALEVAP